MPLLRSFALWVLALFGVAVFAQSSPSELDARRFVAAYRVDETIALVAKDAVYEASMQDGPHKSYYTCISSKLTATAFDGLAVAVVQQQFPDAERLRDATAFFESETGRVLRDFVVEELRQRPVRRYAGTPLAQPGDYPITPAQYGELQRFEKRPAYQDFRRFREAINGIGLSAEIVPYLKAIQATCSTSQSR